MNNYSGLVGQASVLSCHEGDESMWRKPFVVHGIITAQNFMFLVHC